MRQLSFVEPGTVRWEEAADPRLETPEDALVRPVPGRLLSDHRRCEWGSRRPRMRSPLCGAIRRVRSVAIYFSETPLPLLEMYTRGVHFFTGRVNARPLIPEILELVRAGGLHPEHVNSAIIPWDDADRAILADDLKPVFVRKDFRSAA